jgi:hypothetical protein
MRCHKLQGQALIFVQPKDASLSDEEFAKQVFTKLAITNWKGYSAAQSAGIVFGGHAAGIQVGVCSNFDSDSPFPGCVTLQPHVAFGDTDYLVEHAKNIAKQWSNSGWLCFVPREGLYEITNFEDGYLYTT